MQDSTAYSATNNIITAVANASNIIVTANTTTATAIVIVTIAEVIVIIIAIGSAVSFESIIIIKCVITDATNSNWLPVPSA